MTLMRLVTHRSTSVDGCRDRPPLRSPGSLSMCAGGWEAPTGAEGELGPSGLPRISLCWHQSPTSWETPVPLSNWDGQSSSLGCVYVLGPHTKCHLTEAERPTDHRIPPSAEPGKATWEESYCIKS